MTEAGVVENLALEHQLPVFKGRVNSEEFYAIFKQDWQT